MRTIFLTSLLVCLAFGCDDDARAKGGARIKLVMTTVSMPVSSGEHARYTAAIDRFRAKRPDVDVQLIEVTGNYYHKLAVMCAGRIAPDLMWMGQGFGEFANRGAVLDVTDRIARDVDTNRF